MNVVAGGSREPHIGRSTQTPSPQRPVCLYVNSYKALRTLQVPNARHFSPVFTTDLTIRVSPDELLQPAIILNSATMKYTTESIARIGLGSTSSFLTNVHRIAAKAAIAAFWTLEDLTRARLQQLEWGQSPNHSLLWTPKFGLPDHIGAAE